jgi:peptidoglycan/xylan/chitin deacetylase (PgdA/CDA1 family)
MVGLTIDDGWTAQDDVLAVLQARNVQPTLFLTGRAVKNDPSFIKRAVDAGCSIGNHTMDHAWLVGQTKDYIKKDLKDFEDMVRSAAPNATTLPFMRPCGGAVDQTVIDASAESGYRPILWSASAGDSSSSTTPDQMVKNALAATSGAILLMHFSHRAVTALPAIIDGLRANGLEPVSLNRLFQPA